MEKLKLNARAPIFVVDDVFGRTIDLNEYQGKKVLLAFFRNVGCPFCNIRVHNLTKMHEDFRAEGLEMIFFFESSQEVILRSTFHREVSPVPVIADPRKTWYDAYGLEEGLTWKAKAMNLASSPGVALRAKLRGLPVHLPADGESNDTLPAEFLLDEDLVIRELHYSQHFADRIRVDAIREFALHRPVFKSI